MAGGRLAACRGDYVAAADEFLAVGRHHRSLQIVNPTVLPWRSEAGLAARQLGDVQGARALIDEERAVAERFGGPRAVGVARRAAGLLASGDAAVEQLHAAGALLANCGARVEHARALADLGAAIRRTGRKEQARATLREASTIADRIGARRIAERAREELRLAGGRGVNRGGSRANQLTPSERRVAELAAAGQTNRQIANALFITVKAVEWHLSNSYRRLDISGRAELPATLASDVDRNA